MILKSFIDIIAEVDIEMVTKLIIKYGDRLSVLETEMKELDAIITLLRALRQAKSESIQIGLAEMKKTMDERK